MQAKRTEPQFVRTDDVLTDRGLSKLFGFRLHGSLFGVCDGEWRKEGFGWRFYRNADL